jgi:hypothetical protein
MFEIYGLGSANMGSIQARPQSEYLTFSCRGSKLLGRERMCFEEMPEKRGENVSLRREGRQTEHAIR